MKSIPLHPDRDMDHPVVWCIYYTFVSHSAAIEMLKMY